jgi:hypothetical protein
MLASFYLSLSFSFLSFSFLRCLDVCSWVAIFQSANKPNLERTSKRHHFVLQAPEGGVLLHRNYNDAFSTEGGSFITHLEPVEYRQSRHRHAPPVDFRHRP